MADAPRGNVTFLAVARTSDRSVLASCAHGATIDLQGVKYLIHPDQMQQVEVGKHYNFSSGAQAWHLSADSAGLIYIAIAALNYPVRHANARAPRPPRPTDEKKRRRNVTSRRSSRGRSPANSLIIDH